MTNADKKILREMRAELERLSKKIDSIGGNVASRKSNDSLVLAAAVAEKLRTARVPLFLWVKITGNETGGGKYQGKSYQLDYASDASASTSVSEAELGTLSTTVDCRVLNFAEEGETTHDLTSGTPEIDTFLCHWIGTNSDGIKVCAVVAYDRESCA